MRPERWGPEHPPPCWILIPHTPWSGSDPGGERISWQLDHGITFFWNTVSEEGPGWALERHKLYEVPSSESPWECVHDTPENLLRLYVQWCEEAEAKGDVA